MRPTGPRSSSTIRRVTTPISFPVMWLPGDTGRTSGPEVEILDRTGSVIARTGQIWKVAGGYSGSNPTVWVACGYVVPPPTGQ
jgi:hypothetical protein